MKNLIIFFLLFASCSDKYASLYQSAPAPALSFSKDTITIRERDYTNVNASNHGIFFLQSQSSGHQLNIQYNETSGKVHFAYRGNFLKESQPIIIAGDITSLFCSCDEPGIYSVYFFLTDQLGKSTSRELIIHCLANQTAKAALNSRLIDSSQTDNWVYRLDASGCYKPDGLIRSYHYSINDQPILTTNPLMDWTFHKRGEQTISLFVLDDLDQASDTLHQKIFIQ